MKIKENVLKEEVKRELRNEINILGDKTIDKTIDLTLTEVGKVIDEEIKAEIRCLKTDEHDEQFVEHNNQIEMADKIKQKLGIK